MYKTTNNPYEIRLNCPFCINDTKYHLYVNLNIKVYYCFRCNSSGRLSQLDLNSKVSTIEVEQPSRGLEDLPITVSILTLDKLHLARRLYEVKFHPFKTLFCIKGNHKSRLIFPIYQSNEYKGFQSREVDGLQNNFPGLKYKMGNGTIKSKILYNFDQVLKSNDDYVIVVEGISDCTRIPSNTVCIFGHALSEYQIQLLFLLNKSTIYLGFDPDVKVESKKQILYLRNIFNKVYDLELDKDPSEYPKQELINKVRSISNDVNDI